MEPEHQQDHEEKIGKVIAGRYTIIRQIGRGGMGIVYLAQDKKLNRYVACKRLLLENTQRGSIRRRFLQEAQTIAGLGHVYIVNIFDIGKDEEGYYITMEYIAGPSLAGGESSVSTPPSLTMDQYIRKLGPTSSEDARRIVMKVCYALDYAHKNGIVHRDVKPANILLDQRYNPKLVDFGLARPLGRDDNTAITLSGEFVGTPEYIAPEQWGDASDVDGRADIYSLGGVLWFILTGKLPRYFRESEISEELQPILAKALAHRRDDRYQTAKEFGDELKKSDLSGTSKNRSLTDDETITGKWICTNCSYLNLLEAKYCISCGTYGMQPCSGCETEVRIGARHCPNCGIDMKQAGESATTITDAKSHANFLEYETALNLVKDLDSTSFPQASSLAKEWRQTVLRRKNLLTDLESSLRVYNLEKAVSIHKELKVIVPEETLSESLDFDAVVTFSSLDAELKSQLRDAATRAQEDYDLNELSGYIKWLNEVCGPDVCRAINEEVDHIHKELDKIVTRAGLAIGMHCLSRGLDMLLSTSPWKGSELGERRDRMISKCREQIQKREELIDELEESVRKGRYTDALQLIRKTASFRLPPQNSEMEPDDDDIAANERIHQADKILTKRFEEQIPVWVKNDHWKEIQSALDVFGKEEGDDWKLVAQKIQAQVNKKIATRYNAAIESETKGKMLQAEKLWQIFLTIPPKLITSNLFQYAQDFEQRKRSFLQTKRNKFIRRVIFITLLSWLYPLFLRCTTWIFQHYQEGFLPLVKYLTPGIVNFLVFLSFCGIVKSKRMIKAELQHYGDHKSRRFQLLFALLACAPVSYILHQMLSWGISFSDLPHSYGVLFCSILPFWLVFDILKRYLWRIYDIYSLSLGWMVVVCLYFALEKLNFQFSGNLLWPLMLILHATAYLFISTVGQSIAAPSASKRSKRK